MDNFFDFLKTIAPTVAGFIGTPAIGVATEALIKAFDGDEDAANQILSGERKLSSDDIARIKLAEIEAKARKEELGLEFAKLDTQNTLSARERDNELTKAGKHNYRADFMFLSALGMVAVLFFIVWSSPDLSEFMKGAVTLAMGRFLGYIDTIYNFEFGSSRGSQYKDDLIYKSTPTKNTNS